MKKKNKIENQKSRILIFIYKLYIIYIYDLCQKNTDISLANKMKDYY
jgi:hypothetical protein